MQVISPNNVKIYNLSAGKSLPDWISERKKRKMIRSDPDLRDRIELIQDFDMPIVSNQVQMSPDGQYIFATGTYKPRVKCFDLTQYSMKFERCFDSECVKFKILSEDYSKAVFLHNDRYVEFHAQYGKYYKLRIPKFGRDFDYNYSSCDLYFVGACNEIMRFNMEQGRFQTSLTSQTANENNCCEFNPVHELFACGNTDGLVECWDPRAPPKNVGILNCNVDAVLDGTMLKNCSVTSMKFRDGLNLAVGTSTGHILLYDIRSSRPMLVKDHRFELPIKQIEWQKDSDLVLSIDKRVCKIWDRQTGKPFTSIEPGSGLNNLCVVPNSGMMFMANEANKILVYYIPQMGPAPKWCSFLDNLTEELESNPQSTVYDDYKFVTKQELETIGLSNLIGTNVLRAYMHGYFMDIRLYKKAKLLNDPFNFDEFKNRKIKEKLESERENRVKITRKLPKVNSELAARMLEENEESKDKKKVKANTNIMEDKRFAELFTDANFEINPDSEEFRLLNPVVQKNNEKRLKKKTYVIDSDQDSDDEEKDSDHSGGESSSDDEHQWKQQVKEQYRIVNKEKKAKERLEKYNNRNNAAQQANSAKEPKFYELKEGLEYFSSNKNKTKEVMRNEKMKKLALSDRLKYTSNKSNNDEAMIFRSDSFGNKQMTFTSRKDQREKEAERKAQEHHMERKNIRRSAGKITKTFKTPNINYSKRPK